MIARKYRTPISLRVVGKKQPEKVEEQPVRRFSFENNLETLLGQLIGNENPGEGYKWSQFGIVSGGKETKYEKPNSKQFYVDAINGNGHISEIILYNCRSKIVIDKHKKELNYHGFGISYTLQSVISQYCAEK